MEFTLNETQRMVQQVARDYAERRLRPIAAQLDREGTFPTEQLQEMAELGLMGVNIPERLGGAEAGAVAYALAMMEIAAACASTAVTMAVTNMVAEVITAFGTEDQQTRYVPALTSGRYLAGAFALSEPGAGSDPGGMRTTATRVNGGYLLDGQKQWITSGAYAGVLVVWARTGGPGTRGISCFLVEQGAKGMKTGRPEDKMGLRASNTVPLTFECCFVPEEAMLGEPGSGFKIAMMALDGGRIGIASQACGIAQAALDASLRYAKDRQQFGKPIADFQAIQWMLADSATELDAARLLALRAAALKEAKQPFSREASMAKLFASEAANRICNRAVQIHGGYGYTREFPVERYLRDVRVTTIYEGTSEIQRTVIARAMLR
ncbi:MAG: acyl-CoA dehydrogenase family protein [Myxococcales bacterium]|nr:acyl-CoA dehydrogenase family protein [Polyangiaceae bacterium]MDW8249476.1 acyl-CoA dehydrogenase family protein [Myxococcales bacterium]